MVCLVAVLLALVVVGYPESWNQIPAPDSPTERFGHSLVTLDDGRVLIFGGEDYLGGLQNEIFAFDDELQWQSIEAANSPPARFGATMTQVSDHEVLLYGGEGEDGKLNDLWILDTNTWTWYEVVPANEPPPARRDHCAWYYDGAVYIAGGVGADGRPRRDLYRYYVEENTWERGPDAPEDFWGAYATVYGPGCSSKEKSGVREFCSAYILGPVMLLYDLGKEEWLQEVPPPDANRPPSKYYATFARWGDQVYMFGGVYSNHVTTATPCTWSYDFPTRTWTYHHAVPPPYEDTGLWGAQAFWNEVKQWFCLFGGVLGWPFDAWEEFLFGQPESWGTRSWNWNRNVYVYRPDGLAAGPGGQLAGAGQPGGAGKPGGPGGPGPEEEEPPPEEPEYPEEPYPALSDCTIAHAVDDQGEPVDRNPVFGSLDAAAVCWLRISPLCEPVRVRVEVYDAQGRRYDTYTTTAPNPADYGVDCIRKFTTYYEIPLGPSGSRPVGTWWVEIYIDDVLSCTLEFEVTG